MSNEYRKLNLNRENIVNAINHYCITHEYSYKVSDSFERIDKTRNRLKMTINGKDLHIDFHFNMDGTTTMEDFGGKNLELKKELCAYIKENCEIGNGTQNQWFVVEGVSKEDFVASVELIKDSQYCNKTLKESFGESIYQYEGVYGEKCTIKYYESSKKIVVQGKPLLLYLDATEIVANLVDYEGIPKILNENFKVNIDKNSIQEQTKIILEHAYDRIWSIKLKKNILQAVFYMNMDIDMFDYTGLAFHGYRALEGHLRYVLKDNGIILTGTSFSIFDKNKELLSNYKMAVHQHCNDTQKADAVIKYIEKTYKYFGDKRHIYFHWNNPNITGIDDTAVIESRTQAQGLIRESLNLIEKYFTEF